MAKKKKKVFINEPAVIEPVKADSPASPISSPPPAASPAPEPIFSIGKSTLSLTRMGDKVRAVMICPGTAIAEFKFGHKSGELVAIHKTPSNSILYPSKEPVFAIVRGIAADGAFGAWSDEVRE